MKKFIITCLLLATGVAQAFTYQGELSQSGVTYTGSADMMFSLHLTASGGGAVTNDIQNNVSVNNGRFVVELSQWAALFDGTNYWLEIAIDLNASGNFTTLSPRQPISPTPYALFAPNTGNGTGTLWTESGSTIFYDSGNVGIGTAVPTATLHIVGSATAAESVKIDSAGDDVIALSIVATGSPSVGISITATDTAIYGSAPIEGGNFSASAAGGTGLTGFARASAGTGKGVVGISNSPDGHAGYFQGRGYFAGNVGINVLNPSAKLHIGGTPGTDGIKFPDGTLQTTKASTYSAGSGLSLSGGVFSVNQGAGNGLDADLLDGQHASQIIAAANTEVRFPIASLPQSITQSGSYYLSNNLSATTTGGNDGIDISASNVTLDLMGFTIEGNAVADYGIRVTGSNVIIRNGTISGFGNAGVFGNLTTTHSNRVEHLQLLNNGAGNTFSSSGVYLAGSNSRIIDTTAIGNGGHGLYAGKGAIIERSSARNNGMGNTASYGIYASDSSIITNSIASGNGGHGIYVENAAMVSACTVENNAGGFGIYTGDGSSIIGNTVSYSQATGIKSISGAIIKNNTVSYSQDFGIQTGAGAVVTGNSLSYNNQMGQIGGAGMVVNEGSLFENNSLFYNRSIGMDILVDSVIRNNIVTYTQPVSGRADCYRIEFPQVAMIGNVASACNVDYQNINGAPLVNRNNDSL